MWTASAAFARAAGVPRADCFPTDKLPPALQQKSESLLLRALDTEALFTIAGDLKPMSSFMEYRIPLSSLDLSDLETARRALAVWRCGDGLFADVHHFTQPHDGKLYAEAAVWNRRALAAVIASHARFFRPYGITPSTHPMEVAMTIEFDPGVSRFRGYGYLYGYPDYAVDFFVSAEEIQHKTGQKVPREIVSVPTYTRETGLYAWAAPTGHKENDVDRQIKAKAAVILSEYRSRRPRYIGPGKPGVVLLLRDWFDDGKGRCAPENAMTAERQMRGRRY
jgi:hypothetical protein